MSELTSWAAAAASLIGAGLAYVGARRGTRPEHDAVVESRRDEWGRRFAQAIELMTSDSASQRSMGRALFDALLDSDLAGPDDRRLAEHLVRAAVLAPLPASAQLSRSLPAGRRANVVDDIRFVEDDEDEHQSTQEER